MSSYEKTDEHKHIDASIEASLDALKHPGVAARLGERASTIAHHLEHDLFVPNISSTGEIKSTRGNEDKVPIFAIQPSENLWVPENLLRHTSEQERNIQHSMYSNIPYNVYLELDTDLEYRLGKLRRGMRITHEDAHAVTTAGHTMTRADGADYLLIGRPFIQINRGFNPFPMVHPAVLAHEVDHVRDKIQRPLRKSSAIDSTTRSELEGYEVTDAIGAHTDDFGGDELALEAFQKARRIGNHRRQLNRELGRPIEAYIGDQAIRDRLEKHGEKIF